MANKNDEQCKTKNCNNPVFDRKYCEYYKQVRKENGDKPKAIVGAIGIS